LVNNIQLDPGRFSTSASESAGSIAASRADTVAPRRPRVRSWSVLAAVGEQVGGRRLAWARAQFASFRACQRSPAAATRSVAACCARDQDLRRHDKYSTQVALSQMGRFTSLVRLARVRSNPEVGMRIDVANRPMHTQSGPAITGAISNRSFTGWLRFCLQPRYRSVVCTETWPSRN